MLAANYVNRRSTDEHVPTYRARLSVAQPANHENMDVRLISSGYMLQFASPPPCLGLVVTILSSWTDITALTAELAELLEKKAISCTPPGEKNKGFNPRCFLTPKKIGGMRLTVLTVLYMRT